VPEDAFERFPLPGLDESQDFHGAAARGAGQRIDLIDFLYERRR
jgi:hypothetical protein